MDRFYPIHYAASKWAAYGLDENEINHLIADGKLTTHICETPDGGDLLVVADADMRNLAAERIDKSQFAHLEGIPISIGIASRKYNFAPISLSQWVKKGHIKKLGKDGQKVLLDEADVAYARKKADVKGLTPGQSLF